MSKLTIFKKLSAKHFNFTQPPFGFTLIETIITISIFTAAMVAVIIFVQTLYRSQSYAFQQSTAINEARRGIEIMVKEIREANTGEDGSYIIEKADDHEFIFYSDIDNDGMVERVRYFLGGESTGSLSKECVTFSSGGSCGVNFNNFYTGALNNAQITVSVEGDFGAKNEYANVDADGSNLGKVCQSGCTDCAGYWEGSLTFNVTTQSLDNDITVFADASPQVNAFCDWIETNHSMKAKFDLSWSSTLPSGKTDFLKGVTKPIGNPLRYLPENEKVTVISQYVRNGTSTPVFQYFDKDGVEITSTPARPEETTMMGVHLIINVDPNRAPDDFELESKVQLRNLKTNL